MTRAALIGSLFDGVRATPREVMIEILPDDGRLRVVSEGGEVLEFARATYSFEISADAPLVRITISGRGMIELANSEALRAKLQPHTAVSVRLVDWFEKRAHRAGSVLAVALCVVVVFYVYAPRIVIPIVRPFVSEPIQTMIANQAIMIFDKVALAPSSLDGERDRVVRSTIRELQERFYPERPLNVLTRALRGRPEVMNAAAIIPNNILVFDALAQKLSPGEFRAVVLHEIGHLKYQHGLDALIQASFLGVASVAILGGDPGTLHGIALSLLQAQYSQQHEREADLFAARSLLSMGEDPMLLASALDTIERATEAKDAQPERSGAKTKGDDASYFSTHPSTRERRAALERFVREAR